MAIHDSTIIDGQDASTSRSTLGLVLGTDVQIQNAILQAIADLSNSSGCLTNDGAGNLSWAAAGGDFSDGGEAGGAARTLGNTDDYTLGLLSNNVSVITIDGDAGGSLVHLGNGATSTSPVDVVLHGTDAEDTETNTAGASIDYKTGLGTGNSTGIAHTFYTSTPVGSGTTLQTARAMMKIQGSSGDAVLQIGHEAIVADQQGYEIYIDTGDAGAKIGAMGSSAVSYLHLHQNITLTTGNVSNSANIGLAAGAGGAYVTILGTYIGNSLTSPTAFLDIRNHGETRASMRIRSYDIDDVSSPNSGEFWFKSGALKFYNGTDTYRLNTEIIPDNIQTTDDTTTTIQAVAVAADTIAAVKVWVTACLNDASDGMTFCLVGVFKNDSGTTSQIGTTTSIATIGTAGWTVALAADDGTDSVDVNVTGAVATDVNWTARVEVETITDLS